MLRRLTQILHSMRYFAFLSGLIYWTTFSIAPSFGQGTKAPGLVEPSTYMIRHFTTWDGLPANYLRTSFQSKSGYIWIGSDHGLTRYDGKEFHTLNSTTISDWEGGHQIDRICEDQRGAIWFGSSNPKVMRVHVLENPGTDTSVVKGSSAEYLSHYCLDKNRIAILERDRIVTGSHLDSLEAFYFKEKLTSKYVYAYVTGPDELWIISGELVINFRDGAFRYIEKQPRELLYVFRTQSGSLMASASDGAYVFRDSSFVLAHAFPKRIIRSNQQDPHSLWLGMPDSVYVINDEGMRGYAYEHSGIRFDDIGSVKPIQDEVYLVWKIAPLEGRFFHWRNKEEWKSLGLEAYGVKSVTSINQDHESGLWVTSDAGLFHLVPRKMETYGIHEGLRDQQVFALAQDQKGRAWAATWGDGFQRLENGQWTVHNQKDGLLFNFVMAFLPEEDGSVWVGTNRGAMRYLDDKIIESYPYTSAWHLEYEYLTGLLKDRSGKLWVAGGRNLYELKNKDYLPVWPGVVRRVRSVFEDRGGHLYAGTDDGLFAKSNEGEWDQYMEGILGNVSVMSIAQDNVGDLWVSTKGKGLFWKKGDECFQYTDEHGLPSKLIHFILQDDFGFIWAGTDNGLLRIPYSSLEGVRKGEMTKLEKMKVFTEEDGMPSAELISGLSSAFKADDGKLWIATLNGIAIIDPGNIVFNQHKPKVVLQDFAVQGRSQEIGLTQSFRTGRDNTVSFSFATMSFYESKRKAFRVKLEGKDDTWLTTTKNEMTYAQLKPGGYKFSVQGSNNDGVWSDPVSMSFIIAPAFYQAYWFWGLVALAVTGLVSLLVQQVKYRQALRIANTRQGVADDLHDEMGGVHALALFMDALGKKDSFDDTDRAFLNKQSRVAFRLSDELRDYVWAMDSGEDRLDKLIARMTEYATDLVPAQRLHLQSPEQLPRVELDMSRRRNILLLFKEAIHNAVRHNEYADVHIAMDYKQSQLFVTIHDNGVGYDIERVVQGRGMKTMHRRAEELGASLDISSRPGNGTTVRFSLQIE